MLRLNPLPEGDMADDDEITNLDEDDEDFDDEEEDDEETEDEEESDE